MKCTHPSWEPANDGSGRERCGVCGALGSERRFLEVEGESRMPLIPSELLLIVHDPLMGPALLELLRRVKERLDGVEVWRDPDTGRTAPKPQPISAEQAAKALGVSEACHQTKSVSVPSVLPPMSGLSGDAKT